MNQKEEFKELVRIANSDLSGKKPIYDALRKIKGVSFMFANAICNAAKIDKFKKTGSLTSEEVKKIESVIQNHKTIPTWMLNRSKDYDTGEDKHLTGVDLKLSKEFDIRRLKAIKSYRGLRHSWGLPVRGQRTKGHFRKSGQAIGVKKVKRGKKG